MDMYNNFYDWLQVIEPDDREYTKQERLQAMEKPLLFWYYQNRRTLPWRTDPHPYRVWISEIMLQQTRVEAVKPYFNRFMEVLPEVKDLAVVSEEVLLKLWEGLGYYNRARNLKKAAQMMVEQHDGKLPSSYEELLNLPGIGSYTAGAIASIAYGIPVPAVDGNVLRVLSRVLASCEDILKQSVKKKMEQDLISVIPKLCAGDYNQALIEIGALVCIPNGQPKCDQCPLQSLCLGRKYNLLKEIPVKTRAKKRRIENKTVFIIEYKNFIAINKRPDTGLLPSLYELPNVEGHLTKEQIAGQLNLSEDMLELVAPLPEAKHIFSHVEWHMVGYRIRLNKRCAGVEYFVTQKELKEKYAVPNAFKAYMMEIIRK